MSKKLTVACVLWSPLYWKPQFFCEKRIINYYYSLFKKRQFSPYWVAKLKDMVSKNTTHDFDFVCLSNFPKSKFRDDIIVNPLKQNWPGWWSKVELFNKKLPFNERILYLDLDHIIIDNIDPIIEFPADIALFNYNEAFKMPIKIGIKKEQSPAELRILHCPPNGINGMKPEIKAYFIQKKATHIKQCISVPGYNSTCIIMNKNSHPEIYDTFDPTKDINIYCGDQDWITKCLGNNMPTFPKEWGRCLCNNDKTGELSSEQKEAKLIWCFPIKNHLLAQRGYQWAFDVWNGKSIPHVTKINTYPDPTGVPYV